MIRFFIFQSILLGSGAFVAWALLSNPGTWPFSLSLDTLAAAALGVFLTALFLLLFAWPTQFALRKSSSLAIRLLVGAAAGPLGVWLGILIFSSYPIDWNSYVSRPLGLHAIFIGIGVAFAWAWHRRLRPNNSFKPTPLRGAA